MRLFLYFRKFEAFPAIIQRKEFSKKIYNSARGLITFFFFFRSAQIDLRTWKQARVISPRVLSRIKKMVGAGVGRVTKRKHLRRIFNYHDVLLRNTEEREAMYGERQPPSMHLPLRSLLLFARRVNFSSEDGETTVDPFGKIRYPRFFSILIYPVD